MWKPTRLLMIEFPHSRGGTGFILESPGCSSPAAAAAQRPRAGQHGDRGRGRSLMTETIARQILEHIRRLPPDTTPAEALAECRRRLVSRLRAKAKGKARSMDFFRRSLWCVAPLTLAGPPRIIVGARGRLRGTPARWAWICLFFGALFGSFMALDAACVGAGYQGGGWWLPRLMRPTGAARAPFVLVEVNWSPAWGSVTLPGNP